MEIRQGIGVSPGYAIGSAFLVEREEYRIERRQIGEDAVDAEIERLDKAFQAAQDEIREQLSKYARKLGPAADILEAHVKLLDDAVTRDEIKSVIKQDRYTSEYASSKVIRRRIKILADSAQHSFVQRVVQDMNELEKSVLRHLLGAKREDISHLTKPVVVVAHDLSPAQTLNFDRKNILGMITEVGGKTSHTAIVAASLGIPAVVGVEEVTNDISGGDGVILDGGTGKIIIHPDEGTSKRYEAMGLNFQVLGKQLANELRDLPAETKDGHRVSILANIEAPHEIQAALDYGAEGIGLYRTEFLFLQNDFEPTEEHHLAAYREATSLLGDRKLTIRTLDLGADKMPIDGVPRENNPFLGTRAIRLCLERPEIFKTQLRAILKTGPAAGMQIMYPLISSVAELEQVGELFQEVQRGLASEGHPTRDIPVGIMIEVPSAAIIADILAKHVDFLSIGTNDLIAYSIAVDRGNEHVARLYQPAHPAILRMIQGVIKAGEDAGKPVSVCGEMSSDITYTLLLLGMGLKTFSVVPPAIPEIKKIIRSVTLDEAKAVAKKAADIGNAQKTAEYLRHETVKIVPDAL